MTDHRSEAPGENGAPVPRDLPDQQATEGEDPWEVAPGRTSHQDESAQREQQSAGTGGDVPDTDEAGTGPEGAPRSGSVHPEQPVPDEPSA
ncbi:hypothetical protein AB0K80_20720 [Streptomyces sp. NPDC052682]|uniref:hypothetical protein n=1 Tax=Streptomyces sp. NPDC052682 TaxID=3154954 RepID=UPI003431E652